MPACETPMGASNVKAVYALWGDLDHAPHRLLAYMAVRALDVPAEGKPARRFYGGREELALALGRVLPDPTPGDEAVRRERLAAFRAVDRAVAALVSAGAVKVARHAHTGSAAEYALQLDTRQHHAERGPFDRVEHHGERGAEDHGQRRQSTTVSVEEHHAHRGPKEEKEQEGPQDRNTGVDQLAPVTVARARCDHGVPASIRCPACSRGLGTQERHLRAV